MALSSCLCGWSWIKYYIGRSQKFVAAVGYSLSLQLKYWPFDDNISGFTLKMFVSSASERLLHHKSAPPVKDCRPTLSQQLLQIFTNLFHFISYIYIAPLQDFYSEALPTTERTLNRSFTPKRMSNCEWRTCPGSLRGGLRWIRIRNPPAAKAPNIPLHHRAPLDALLSFTEHAVIYCKNIRSSFQIYFTDSF